MGIITSIKKRNVKRVGSKKGIMIKHHTFIFTLYLENPTLPNVGYCEDMEKEFGMVLSSSFVA